MGRVHEAVHRSLEKRVAIKQLHPHLAVNRESLGRFIAEGKAMARLRHAHVVEVFDLGEENGVPYLVMELLEGCTLGERLARGVPLSLLEAVDLALPLASALSAAHAAGIVHRDVKPSNVLLRNGALEAPCIVDFGVSKQSLPASADELTRSNVLVGSYPYFSPEHTRGARCVTAQSDQYSLAVVIYECVTGTRPFQGDDAYELMHAIATRDVQAPSRVRASIPREFDDVLLRAMHRDPLHRYPTMQAFGSSLLGFASRRSWHVWSEQFAGASPHPSLSERTTDETLAAARPGPRRARAGVLLAITIAIALLSCGVSALVRPAPAVAPGVQASSAPSAPPRPVESSAASIPLPVAATDVPPAPVVPASAHAAHPAPSQSAPSHFAPNVVAGTPAERGSNGVAILE
jgi:serine/threonine-protein kinase